MKPVNQRNTQRKVLSTHFHIYKVTDAQNWLVIDSKKKQCHACHQQNKCDCVMSEESCANASVLLPLFVKGLLIILLQGQRSVLHNSDMKRIIVHSVSFLILSGFMLSLLWKWTKGSVQPSKLFIAGINRLFTLIDHAI